VAGSIGKAVYAKLTGDTAVLAIIGSGLPVFPDGGVPEDQQPPWGEFRVTGNTPDRNLEGTLLGYDTEVSITWTTSTYEECQALLDAAAAALSGMTGTIAGVTVAGSEVIESSDEPNGPIDLDEAQVYQGDMTVMIYQKAG
jgi:hypothetical protein